MPITPKRAESYRTKYNYADYLTKFIYMPHVLQARYYRAAPDISGGEVLEATLLIFGD